MLISDGDFLYAGIRQVGQRKAQDQVGDVELVVHAGHVARTVRLSPLRGPVARAGDISVRQR